MNKKTREQVRLKYNGLCAYTGKLLGDDWQVDHMTSVYKQTNNAYYTASNPDEINIIISKVHDINNLMPALRIVNHYKRSLDLEGFRDYMSDFHKRLAKLPKKTSVERTAKRIEYMNKVADAFDITTDKPFSGLFFFEK
ncbi:MAG: hypothetical protein [Caudoviricetes sp.]|nr:MAG: hypothetical protein [Caudoviricetes sp.]